jgi:hypothetical protein
VIKDNDHIRADQAAFFDAFLRARETFKRIDGVEGVGYGHKETGGDFTNDVGITVFVRDKKSNDALSPDERIPPTFEGYRTDVRVPVLGRLLTCDDQTHYPVIKGGIQIESNPRTPVTTPGREETGTLGCIVKRRGNDDRDNVFLLTCKHVLTARGAQEDDYMYHPRAPRKGSGATGESLGAIQPGALSTHMDATVPGATPGTTITDHFYIDAGIARINIDSKCLGTRCTKDSIKVDQTLVFQLGDLTDVRSIVADTTMVLTRQDPDVIDSVAQTFPRVFKVGRTTGKTTGVVRNLMATTHFQLSPTSPRVQVDNVIEIDYAPLTGEPAQNCKGAKAFAEPGDSGAVVVDADNRVVGLVFMRSTDPESSDSLRFRAFACHILPVLDKLGICIVTKGGTSHGSSGALDGSGVTPVRTAADEPHGDGLILLTADPREAVAPWPEPETDTEQQSTNMLAFRDALRETALGCELHDTFRDVRREIGFLIRSCRPVKVMWHRNQGPAFMAHVIKHLLGDAETIPREINGVSREMLLRRMGEALIAHGSHPLSDAIERFGPMILSMVDAETADDCLAMLRRAEPTDRVLA